MTIDEASRVVCAYLRGMASDLEKPSARARVAARIQKELSDGARLPRSADELAGLLQTEVVSAFRIAADIADTTEVP